MWEDGSSDPHESVSPLQWSVLFLLTAVYLVGPFCSMLDAQDPMLDTWIDGTHSLIARTHRMVDEDWRIEAAPSRVAAQGLRPQVGDQRKFYAVDFARSGAPYSINATCRAVGKFCYIFVEDEQWQRGSVTHTGVVKLKRAFDESTPADPARGIYKLETEELGPSPDEIDLDPKIYILALDILDDYARSGNFIAGYFEPINQKRGVVREPGTGLKFYSNEVEMLYIDTEPLDVGGALSKEILAHELQHLIHWRHDSNEDLWVNEGCSDYAALFLCGYGEDFSWHVEAFESEPQTSLVYWPGGVGSSMANYGAAYLWTVYLHERYGGISTISSLIAHPSNGINGVNSILSTRGYSQTFEGVFSDWKVANFLDDVDSERYGYDGLDIEMKPGRRHSSFTVSDVSRYIPSWAADYIEFTGGDGISDLQIDFTGRNPNYSFDVRVIKMKDDTLVAVESVPIQKAAGVGHISVPNFGYAVDTVILVSNWQPKAWADFGEIVSYSYSARLGKEINIDAVVLPNAVHERYLDIVVQLDEDIAAAVPSIKVTRLGRTLVDEQNMVSISSLSSESDSEPAYVYQLYVPHGWDHSEIRWDIYYLGRWVAGGDLDDV